MTFSLKQLPRTAASALAMVVCSVPALAQSAEIGPHVDVAVRLSANAPYDYYDGFATPKSVAIGSALRISFDRNTVAIEGWGTSEAGEGMEYHRDRAFGVTFQRRFGRTQVHPHVLIGLAVGDEQTRYDLSGLPPADRLYLAPDYPTVVHHSFVRLQLGVGCAVQTGSRATIIPELRWLGGIPLMWGGLQAGVSVAFRLR